MNAMRQGGFLIAKIHQLSGRIFARILKQHKIDQINPSQGRILFVLWNNDEITFNELSKKTSLGKSTLTSMLDRLEANGHLTRMPSSEDRRTILIKRTEKDKSLQKIYETASNEMTKIFYKDFKSKEIDDFEKSLNRIMKNLNEDDQK
jgi:DNA-binding MarR family transcriptional regulator